MDYWTTLDWDREWRRDCVLDRNLGLNMVGGQRGLIGQIKNRKKKGDRFKITCLGVRDTPLKSI